MSILEVSNVRKIYSSRFGAAKTVALCGTSFSVENGEFVAIMGESGSGKTTLLNLIASLDRPTSGDIILDGKKLSEISDKELSVFRRENLGFVFQDFNLLDTFSIRDNIFLPLVLARKSYEEMSARLEPLAKRLEIQQFLDKFPYEVSGGQKQRCAIGRALITNPKMLLADEPTGALDSRTSDELLKLFEEINISGQTILMVTHSVKAASRAGRVLFLRDGEVFHQLYRAGRKPEEMIQKIYDTISVLGGGEARK
ncbi:MAG: ABC transporter ATP-binding protein [Oscillospiraceae bacterium]|nr:ABC transporter ATP-binding protein [Oscillospiraceae bacterium]